MQELSRRQVMRGAAGGAALLGMPALAQEPSGGDDLRVACVGIRSRGGNHIDAFSKLKGVRVVALCDVDEKVLAQRLKEASDRGLPADGYTDIRRLLERKDIDAVSLATPNHLHALHTIWACQAGKHVYVEKPVSHNLWEGRQAVLAARKYGRVVQAGTQSRSSQAIAEAIAWMRAGNLGQVLYAWGTCFKPRKSIGKVAGPQEVPASVHWDLYCGPRGEQPLRRRELHYDWHWQTPTGNGDLGNQGIHQMDLCRFGLGEELLAGSALSVGGRFGYEDDGDTPNTQFIVLGYKTPLVFEVRGLPRDKAATSGDWGAAMDRRMGSAIGATIHCEGGFLHFPDYSSARALDQDGKEVRTWNGTSDHFENFIQAVRAGDSSLLHADIEQGHISSGLCHMGLDSHKLGERQAAEGISRAMNTPLALEAWERFQAHLAAHEIDLDKDQAVLGRALRLDPATEVYADPEARALARGTYAKGFEIPDEV